MLYNSCRGHPSADEELNFDQERKSVSSEVNYGIRFNNMEECRKFVIQLSEEVCKRLEDISPNLMARALTVKLMVRAECEKGKETAKFMGHGICDSHSKSSNFASPTNDSRVITKEVLSVLNRFAQSFLLLLGAYIFGKVKTQTKICILKRNFLGNYLYCVTVHSARPNFSLE